MTDREVIHAEGQVHRSAAHFEEAVEHLEEAIEDASDKPRQLVEQIKDLGRSGLGRASSALRAALRALQARPERFWAGVLAVTGLLLIRRRASRNRVRIAEHRLIPASKGLEGMVAPLDRSDFISG